MTSRKHRPSHLNLKRDKTLENLWVAKNAAFDAARKVTA